MRLEIKEKRENPQRRTIKNRIISGNEMKRRI
jgi:hypothetical protein